MQELISGVTLTYHFHLADSGETWVRKKTLRQLFVFFLSFNVFYFLCKVTRLDSFMQMQELHDLGDHPYWTYEREIDLFNKVMTLWESWRRTSERLTLDILDASIDDLLMRYQRHTSGVPGRFIHLLHRVVWDVMCYHEHHQLLCDLSLKASIDSDFLYDFVLPKIQSASDEVS